MLIDGKAFAAGLRARVRDGVAALTTRGVAKPGLATVLVGTDPASEVYVRSKSKTAAEGGMANVDHRLPAETSQAELLALLGRLNADPVVSGILVQLPLPAHIDTTQILLAVDPSKDVDGFHPINVGRLGAIAPGAPLDFPVPCTPLGCSMLLADTLGSLSGRNAVVVGRSTLVGRPVAQLLLRADCTVTIAHSRTRDLPALCRTADILVVAIGKPQFVQGRLDQAGRRRNRRRHQPHPHARRQDEAGGRRSLRRSDPGGRSHHAGAGRCRPDDRGLPDVQHPAGGPPRRGPAVRRRLVSPDHASHPATSAATLWRIIAS